jgi:hypothetical protein
MPESEKGTPAGIVLTVDELARGRAAAIIAGLRKGTPPESIQYLAKKVRIEPNKKPQALAIAYVDSAYIEERLDRVVGPLSWQMDVKQAGDITVVGIGIKNPITGEWLWKWDTGQEPDDENEPDDVRRSMFKGNISTGFKRAGYRWGIARDVCEIHPFYTKCKVNDQNKWIGWDGRPEPVRPIREELVPEGQTPAALKKEAKEASDALFGTEDANGPR